MPRFLLYSDDRDVGFLSAHITSAFGQRRSTDHPPRIERDFVRRTHYEFSETTFGGHHVCPAVRVGCECFGTTEAAKIGRHVEREQRSG